jgi:uncharacterized protein (DUF1778 family)
MATETRTTDNKARICLPRSFANVTVIIEQVSDTELRIRKARVVPEDEFRFEEEWVAPLSDRDRDIFLSLLDNPPPPNEALRKAAKRHPKRVASPSLSDRQREVLDFLRTPPSPVEKPRKAARRDRKRNG